MDALEHVLADAELDYASLPYEPDVLNLALAARAQGRKVYVRCVPVPKPCDGHLRLSWL